MSELDAVKAMISESDVLKARWESVSNSILEEVRNDYGIEIDRGDLLHLSSVKLMVLANDDSQDWRHDLELNHAAMKRVSEVNELRRALDSEDAVAQAQAQAALDGMKPEERMRLARQAGAKHASRVGAIEAKEMTAERKAELIRENAKLRGGMKLAHARKWGLV